MRDRLSLTCQWLLIPAIYVGGWNSDSSLFQIFQLVAVAIIIFAGFLALRSGNAWAIAISTPEYILGFAFVFGILVALVRGEILPALYGFIFFLLLVSIAVLTRYFDEVTTDTVFRRVYLAILASTLLLQSNEYLTSVSGTVEYAVGLVRFEPLGMQTNLCGLVYGGGSLLFLKYYFISNGKVKKLGNLLISIFCLSMVFAASARASLLALSIVGVMTVILLAWRGSNRARMILMAFGILTPLIIIIYNTAIVNFLSIILDLDSDTRGIDSGATGRGDIWADGIDLVFSNTLLMFFGRGVRGAGDIGFPVESSYINLALEHGVIISVLIVLCFFTTVWRTIKCVTQADEFDYSLLFDGSMLLFILVQSIFNRYLIAIGNPYSLLVLFLLLRLNLSKRVITEANTTPTPIGQKTSQVKRW